MPIEHEPIESQEPTVQELLTVVKEHLSEEQLADLAELDFETALGLVFSYLLGSGIDDPEQFLIEKGILEGDD